MKIGQRIAEARLAAGLSRKALASRCGVHPAQVTRWEVDGRIPNACVLPALCGVLGLDYADLLGKVPQEDQELPPEAALRLARQQRARIVAALNESARIIQGNAMSHSDKATELARAQGWREAAYLADVTALVGIE